MNSEPFETILRVPRCTGWLSRSQETPEAWDEGSASPSRRARISTPQSRLVARSRRVLEGAVCLRLKLEGLDGFISDFHPPCVVLSLTGCTGRLAASLRRASWHDFCVPCSASMHDARLPAYVISYLGCDVVSHGTQNANSTR